MRVLFVAFEFPPLGGAGVQRSIQFTKYLPGYDIEPIVVTTDLPSFLRVMDNPIDQTLLNDLDPNLIVERIPCQTPWVKVPGRFASWARLFFSVVDPLAGYWRPQLDAQIPRLISKYQPAAIYVSIPPFSMGRLWTSIGKSYGLPVVLDFRDAWSQFCIGPYMSWLHYRLALREEGACVRAASRVVCTSDQTRSELLRLHPNVSAQKITTITNGYDAEVGDVTSPRRENSSGSPFVIGYVGGFYYTPETRESMLWPWWRKRSHRKLQYAPRREDWLYRSAYFFFRAVRLVLDVRPELRHRLRIQFVGDKPNWIDAQIDEYGLRDIVEFRGRLPRHEALAFQHRCDSLLITSSKVMGGRDYSIAGKTFEYFVTGRPILGFVTEGAQRDILEESGVAVICDPDNAEDAAKKIQDLIDGRIQFRPNVRFLRSLHRRQLSGTLADIIKDATSASPLRRPQPKQTTPETNL
jgi:glycosyltransferase involved in cell wall biosynthesis